MGLVGNVVFLGFFLVLGKIIEIDQAITFDNYRGVSYSPDTTST